MGDIRTELQAPVVGVMQVIIKAIYYMLFSPFCPDITSSGIL